MKKGARFTIRKTNDREAVFEMDNTMFPGCHNLQDMEGELHLWLVWHKGKRVGYCATKVFDDFVFLARCGVLEEYRGNGLQKRMITVREKCHGGFFLTYTRRSNCASINNLIGCGYRTYWPESKFGGRDAVYWMKEICNKKYP